MNRIDEKKLNELFPPILFLVLGCFISIFFFALYGDRLITSDTASDLVLARFLNEEGKIVSPNWYYSTELLLIDTQLFFKPALLLFPNDWHMARLTATIALTAVYLFSVLLVTKAADIGHHGIWAAALCSFPIGLYYIQTVSFQVFYIPNIFFLLITLSLLLFAIHYPNRTILFSILLAILSFITGLRTMRTIFIFNMPVLATACILFFSNRFIKKQNKNASMSGRDKSLIIYSVIMFAAASLGYLFNKLVIAKSYKYVTPDVSLWSEFSSLKMIHTFDDLIASFGWHDGAPILSIEGISSCFGLMLGIMIIASAIIMLIKFSDLLNYYEHFFVLYFVTAVIICDFIFAHNNQYTPRYWVDLMPVGYLIVSIAIKYIKLNIPSLQKIKYDMLCGVFILFTSISWIVMPYGSQGNGWSLLPVISWINEQGYKQGIATFWQSNITTELTDGKIEMWTVIDFEQMESFQWLQETSHDVLPDDNVFILMTKDEYDHCDSGLNNYIVYQTPDYVVLDFSDEPDYRSTVTNAYR